MNRADLGSSRAIKLRIPASRNDSGLAPREIFETDADKNFADQAAVAEDRAGHHRHRAWFSNRRTGSRRFNFGSKRGRS